MTDPPKWPTHCGDCGAVLMGSWTQHSETCFVTKILREMDEAQAPDPGSVQ